jgi:RecA-family ATPase
MTDRVHNKLEELKKEIEDEKFNQAISLDELMQTNFPENSWLIEKLIPHEGITIISGAPASFKTWLILQMALSISSGEKFIGEFETKQGGILIVDEENHPREVRKRIQILGAKLGLPIYLLSRKGFIVTDEKQREMILNICEKHNLDTIFFDSLVRINKAEENDATQMSEVFRSIMSLCDEGKTVVLTHHERKEGFMKSSASNRLRGSSDILAAADCHISVSRDSEDKTKLIIEQSKLRCDKELDIFEVSAKENESGQFTLEYMGVHTEAATKKEISKGLILQILEGFTDGLSKKDLVAEVMKIQQIGEKTIYSALRKLIKEQLVLEKQGLKNEKICYLPQ